MSNYELLEKFAKGDIETLNLAIKDKKTFIVILEQASARMVDHNVSRLDLSDRPEDWFYLTDVEFQGSLDALFVKGLEQLHAHIQATNGYWTNLHTIVERCEDLHDIIIDDQGNHSTDRTIKDFALSSITDLDEDDMDLMAEFLTSRMDPSSQEKKPDQYINMPHLLECGQRYLTKLVYDSHPNLIQYQNPDPKNLDEEEIIAKATYMIKRGVDKNEARHAAYKYYSVISSSGRQLIAEKAKQEMPKPDNPEIS